MQTNTSEAGTLLLPGNPTFKNGRFQEAFDVDVDALAVLGLPVPELGYNFFEPQENRQLLMLRGMVPGASKDITITNRGVATQKKITVFATVLLQDATGKLYSWDVSSKGAYGQLLQVITPAAKLARATVGPGELSPTHALKDQLQRTFDCRRCIWVSNFQEEWTIKGASVEASADFWRLLDRTARAVADVDAPSSQASEASGIQVASADVVLRPEGDDLAERAAANGGTLATTLVV